MLNIWKEHGFEILFWVSVVVLLFIFVVNVLSGKKGTYDDHTTLIWNLLNKPTSSKVSTPKQAVSFESKGEAECRRVAEEYTGLPFRKARPSFLRNEVTGGHNLELDCYNEKLKIGIEYNGRQHYNFVPHFHATKDAFYNIKYRDDLKQRLCKENNVKLIIVPYTVKDIKSYLQTELARHMG